MQSIIRSAIKYFSFFLLLYGAMILLSLIPSVGSFCNQVYRQPTESILKTLLPKAYLQLKQVEGNPQMIKVEFASKAVIQQQQREAKGSGKLKIDIKGFDYKIDFYNLFLSFFLFLTALILLSPISLKEKGWSLLMGTVLFYLYTVFKIYLASLSEFNQPATAIYQTGDGLLSVVRSVLFFMTLGTNVLVVLILWIVLVFRKNNWKELLKLKPSVPSK